MLFQNGDFFIGDWHEGYAHGKGEYKSENGSSYVGEWKNGQ